MRIIARDNYFKRRTFEDAYKAARRVIQSTVNSIKIPSLQQAAGRSLLSFFSRAWNELERINPADILLLAALLKKRKVLPAVSPLPKMTETRATRIIADTAPVSMPGGGTTPTTPAPFTAPIYGNAGEEYSKTYMRRVELVMNELADMDALDPDSTRATLRARAEIEVRHQRQLDDRATLERRGVKLVIISAHADCSERCAPFQGRVFSLDGTTGRTEDGKPYEPIENATNIYARSKSGEIYPYYNGLFGFNCRHYMTEYKAGMAAPKWSKDRERREYAITERQRQLERQVRKWKARAEMYKGIDDKEYKRARLKAREYDAEYIRYSRENERAYYPSRTKLL